MAAVYHTRWGLATALALALAAPAAVRAQEDLVRDVESAAGRMDAPVRPPRAPEFRATDMYGKEVALSDYRGANVVLTFLSPACVKDAVAWLRGVQTNYLGQRDVVFVNVLHPGPTPAFSSRGANLKRIRDRIEEFYTQARDKMPADERKHLESSEIRWIVDWKRDLHERYDVVPDRVTILLIDGSGHVREQLGRRTPETERRLSEVLDSLRADARQ